MKSLVKTCSEKRYVIVAGVIIFQVLLAWFFYSYFSSNVKAPIHLDFEGPSTVLSKKSVSNLDSSTKKEEDRVIRELYKLMDNFDVNADTIEGKKLGRKFFQWVPFYHGVSLREGAFKILRESRLTDDGKVLSPRVRIALADLYFYIQGISLTERDTNEYPLSVHMDDYNAYFMPTYSCETLFRLGRVGDGGKFVCNIQNLNKNGKCVMYSFGVKDEIWFDTEFAAITGCESHSFDPTIPGYVMKGSVKPILDLGSTNFHDLGVGVQGTQEQLGGKTLKSVADIAKDLGHEQVNVFKFDIEYSEHSVIPDMIKNNVFEKLNIQIIMAEYHCIPEHFNKDKSQAYTKEAQIGMLREHRLPFLKMFHDQGYLMVANEPNLRNLHLAEFSFAHRDYILGKERIKAGLRRPIDDE